MNTLSPLAALACALALSVPARAQVPTASAASAPAAPYRVTGFRSAKFGMTEPEVRAAIAHDFRFGDGALTASDDPAKRMHVLALHLSHLAPAPGVVNLSYVFDAASHRLIHVDVAWTTGDHPSDLERSQMAGAGVSLAHYFRALTWQPGRVTAGAMPRTTTFVFFDGVDPNEAAVDLRASGVRITEPGSAPIEPTGPAVLRLAYVESVKDVDMARRD
jgi:hypothetical protein